MSAQQKDKNESVVILYRRRVVLFAVILSVYGLIIGAIVQNASLVLGASWALVYFGIVGFMCSNGAIMIMLLTRGEQS